MIQFATPETIKPIRNPHPIPQDRTVSDHVMSGPGPVWNVVLPTGKWLDFAWDNPEIQKVTDGDLYWCVTFSHNSAWRFLWRAQYSVEDFNVSERFPAIGAGTKRGVGIGVRALAEWCRLNGFVFQEDCPTPAILDLAYEPLDKALFDKGKTNLQTVELGYKFLVDNREATINEGLKYSPVQVSVQNWNHNGQGYMINNPAEPDYVHEVIVVEDMDAFWAVWDSENAQWLRYDKSYQFLSPMIHSIKKKLPMLYKQIGYPAIYALDPINQQLVPFSDGGGVAGGTVFKTIYGVDSYDKLLIKKVDVLPFPMANWAITGFKNTLGD